MDFIFTNKTIHGTISYDKSTVTKTFNVNEKQVDQECFLSLLFSQFIPQCVPKIYNYHKENNYTLLKMEKIEGITLKEFLKYKHNIYTKYEIISQMLQKLKQIHNLGYCHNDFHDENIIITNNYNVKIIDFGCVKRISEDGLYDDYMYIYTHISHLLFEIDTDMENILYVTNELGPEDIVGDDIVLAHDLYNILETIYLENNL
jgi:serine/threonine protein kinase